MLTRRVDLQTNITGADVIYVDVEVELKDCARPIKLGIRRTLCHNNHFEIYLGNSSSFYHRQHASFSKLYNVTNHTSPDALLLRSNQTFSFRPNISEAVFAVRSTGACGTIYKLKLYYYECEEMITNLVRFQQTPSPAAGFRAVTGNCLNNAFQTRNSKSLIALCHSNGSWAIDEKSSCACGKGYYLYKTIGCIGK